jgi:hypothetical protein
VKAATALAVGALLLGSCGEEERSATKGSTLTVAVHPRGPSAPGTRHIVQCPGDAGCNAPLAPVPSDRACTEIYGGPATATVDDGKRTYRFNLTNGCEIARWQKAAALLGDPP